ncbi:MAG TPA: glutathione peroxidase [Actinomycetes bacterium]|nr:glutathione peroxidase [Actinomycetes bacterium]
MALYDIPIRTLDNRPMALSALEGRAALIVNVASECGFTPQYAGLERLHERYQDRGFTVLGVPCNQFGGQEPGTADEIATFCSINYGVTFPITEKVEVNGPGRHPLYQLLTGTADGKGEAGDVKWNFEKFVVSADGLVTARFRTRTEPESDRVVGAIEAVLPN